MIKEIETCANQILAQSPGVVVHFSLLRDVLRRSPKDPAYQLAKQNLYRSGHVQALAGEQRGDGGWGRFHSNDTQHKAKIPTTEYAIDRALSLGLDAADPILSRAATYIINTMQGVNAFPDRHEKNDRWDTGMRLFMASTLSLFDAKRPELKTERKLWGTIAKRTFQSGKYSQRDEIKAHADLTGATIKNSYLVLSNRYTINLIASIPGELPIDLEMAILAWLFEKPDGIGYLGISLNREPAMKPGYIDR